MSEIEIPEKVFDALSDCRDTGLYNMFDYKGVTGWCVFNGYDAAVDWLLDNRTHYGTALVRFGEWLSKNS